MSERMYLQCLKLATAIAIGIVAIQADPVRAQTCNESRYLLQMSSAAISGDIDGKQLINGAPFKIYEGEPIEWNHFVATDIGCDQNIDTVKVVAGANAVAAIFPAAAPEPAASDLVPTGCTAPVYLLVVNTVTDPAKFETYITAVRKSEATSRHGLNRLFGGSPEAVLAGAWPDKTTAWLSEWPCFEAFDSMYQSDLLQNDLLPMRTAAARYRLMVFREALGR